MRKIFLPVLLISSLAIKAQTPLSFGFTNHSRWPGFENYHIPDSTDKKWSFSSYSAISTGFIFSGSGNASFLAAPLGLQLNRRLSNNLYAFAGISAAPAYINFNSSFLSPDLNKAGRSYGFLNANKFGMYSRAELGLMYVNDERTFSISGSIGVESSSYPLFPFQPPGRESRIRPADQRNK